MINRKRCDCRCLLLVLFAGVFATGLEVTMTQGEFDMEAMRCILSTNQQQCLATNIGGAEIPGILMQLFGKLNATEREIISSGQLEDLPSLTKFSSSLLYLIPKERLKNVNGSLIAELVRKHENAALTSKLVQVLETKQQRIQFLTWLREVELPEAVQVTLAKTLMEWSAEEQSDVLWETQFHMTNTKTNILAHLPAHFVISLHKIDASKMLFHLRNWEWDSRDLGVWLDKPWAVKRVWAALAFRENYPKPFSQWRSSELKSLGFLLEGATPDELDQLSPKERNTNLFNTKMNKLPSRSLFGLWYGNAKLSSENLTAVLPLALHLSPRDLQQFSINSTDFRLLMTLPPDRRDASFATARQIAESLIAQSVVANPQRMSSDDPSLWKEDIKHLGRFAYVLPLKTLRAYRENPPSASTLLAIDSDRISATQARLLTDNARVIVFKRQETVLGLRGMLRAVPTFRLIKLKPGNVPQHIRYQLLQNMPADSAVRSVALLQKARDFLGDGDVLEKMLSNKHPNQFFSLMTPREVASVAKRWLNVFFHLQVVGFKLAIKNLPQQTLSVLLSVERRELMQNGLKWSMDTFSAKPGLNLALLGLSCDDVAMIETTDFVAIMSWYNAERMAVGKVFPKSLQYCIQTALLDYLTLKVRLQQLDVTASLLEALDCEEVDAVGGYVLASLPLQSLQDTSNTRCVLEAIGRLPLPELLLALSGRNPRNYTLKLLDQLVDYENLNISMLALQSLGSTIQFLHPSEIVNIHAPSFRIYVESLNKPTSKVLCADSASRRAWYHLIVQSFGPATSWTAGVLGTLGDLLVALPDGALNLVPAASWRLAADTLTQQTSYHVTMEWLAVEKPVPLLQVCSELMTDPESGLYLEAVRRLVRRYLLATQALLHSVMTAGQLLAQYRPAHTNRTVGKLRLIPIQIDREPLIRVMEPENVDLSGPASNENWPKTNPHKASIESSTTVMTISSTTTLESSTVTQMSSTELDSKTMMPITSTTEFEFDEDYKIDPTMQQEIQDVTDITSSTIFTSDTTPVTDKTSTHSNIFTSESTSVTDKISTRSTIFTSDTTPVTDKTSTHSNILTSESTPVTDKINTHSTIFTSNTTPVTNVMSTGSTSFISSDITLISNITSTGSTVFTSYTTPITTTGSTISTSDTTVTNLTRTSSISFTSNTTPVTNLIETSSSADITAPTMSFPTTNNRDTTIHAIPTLSKINIDNNSRVTPTDSLATNAHNINLTNNLSNTNTSRTPMSMSIVTSILKHSPSSPEDTTTSVHSSNDTESGGLHNLVNSPFNHGMTTAPSSLNEASNNLHQLAMPLNNPLFTVMPDVLKSPTTIPINASVTMTTSLPLLGFTNGIFSYDGNTNVLTLKKGSITVLINTTNISLFPNINFSNASTIHFTVIDATSKLSTKGRNVSTFRNAMNRALPHFGLTNGTFSYLSRNNLTLTIGSFTVHINTTNVTYITNASNIFHSSTSSYVENALSTNSSHKVNETLSAFSGIGSVLNSRVKRTFVEDSTFVDANNKMVHWSISPKIQLNRRLVRSSENITDRQHKNERELFGAGSILRSTLNGNKTGSKKNVVKVNSSIATTSMTINSNVVVHDVFHLKFINQISCESVKAAGMCSTLALEVEDVESWSPFELEECLEMLGSLNFGGNVQAATWNRIDFDDMRIYLADLENLVTFIGLKDIEKLNFSLDIASTLDTISVLGRQVMDVNLMGAIAEKFALANPDIVFTTEILVALGRLFCHLPETTQSKLDTKAMKSYIQALPELGKMAGCSHICLRKLALLATEDMALGSPTTWTAEDMAILGVIAAGLEVQQWSLFTSKEHNPLTGLQPSAVRCISPLVLKELDPQQLSFLSPMAVAAVTKEQLSHLSESQKVMLARVGMQEPISVLEPIHPVKDSGTSPESQAPLILCVILIVMLLHLKSNARLF